MEKPIEGKFFKNVFLVMGLREKGLEPIFESDIHVNCIPVCADCVDMGKLVGCSKNGNWMFCNNCQNKECE